MTKKYDEMTKDEKDEFIKNQIQKMLDNYPKRHYDDVLVKIKSEIHVPKTEIQKEEIPDFVEITENETMYYLRWLQDLHYIMTNNIQELRERFLQYNIPFPNVEDFKNNTKLAQEVRDKMDELKVHFSMIIYNNELILNWYRKNDGSVPMIYKYPLPNGEYHSS